MQRRLALPICVAMFFGSAAIAEELDVVTENCNSCHGDNGVSQWSDVPTIAGIDAFVHAEALYTYRDEARPCAESKYRQGDTDRPPTRMCDIASELSDDAIEALAEHYAALPFRAARQDFDAALAAVGKEIHDRDCARCHSDGGSNPDDEAGILAGQWMDYLRLAFAEYASGDREQLEKMQEKMAPLSAADVEALLHYYASQQ
ncbi:MAG: c-type cytochrome [Gammaproteobacteria bacterium]|nr:c-type cytochrome [Gammaproteobacteria bacterium]MDH5304248.1 c-type cytochrome [Gammaproteobacteria bacterium]MDH5321441.1 c-type cytochrome [Gammaproteobacteria bacterium]